MTSKFCKDCSYYKPWGRFDPHLCKHPENGEVSPVHGVILNSDRTNPEDMRKAGGKCGPDGAMWTQKRSAFKGGGFMSMLLLD